MSETEKNLVEVKPSDSDKKPEDTPGDKAQNTKTKAVKTKNKPVKSGRGLAALALLLAAGSLGVTGYIGWQGKQLQEQVAANDQGQDTFKAGVEQLQSQMARQQARLNDVVTGVKPLQGQLNELRQREERLVNRVDSATLRLKDLEGNSRDQWRLAEVEYLMRLANQRLLMGTDVASARNLLQSADDILVELDDYSLFPIREALAEDMAMVRTVSDFDQETVYLRLQALTTLIPKLQLLDDQRLKMSDNSSAESSGFTTEAPDWQEKVKAVLLDTWQQFIHLFRINTDREKPIEPLLSEEQEMLIRQNLRLMFEQAKLAVLTREPAVYQSSIKQAKQWITDYFTLGGDVRDAMLEELNHLSQITIVTEMPNINRSLEALKTYQLRLETPATEPVKRPPEESQKAPETLEASQS